MNADELLVLVPTRGRPQAIGELIDAWEATDTRAALLFAVDDDDPCLCCYEDVFNLSADRLPHAPIELLVGPRLRLAGTLNAISAKLVDRHPAIGFMGDDHRPRTVGWDRRFAECLSGGAGIVYGNDLLVGVKFPTAVMMTSDILKTTGYMCPPGMVHLCLDLVWKDWGVGMGRITYLGDVIIEHMHPANGKAQLDEGYEECNSTSQVEADTKAYCTYRDDGGLDADVEKLRALL